MRDSTVRVVTGGAGRGGDRLVTYAIGISVLVHLAALGIIGGTSAARMNTPVVTKVPRYIKVDLIDYTKRQPAAPKPVATLGQPKQVVAPNQPIRPMPVPEFTPGKPFVMPSPAPVATHSGPRPSSVNPRPVTVAQVPGNPGGGLNTGSMSSHGDIGNPGGGRTEVGSVPGRDGGPGRGSGDGPGVAPPDPPKHADPGPGTRPAPEPPPVRMVSLKVCGESGLRAGENCKRIRAESFVDGREPSRTCDKCDAEFKSRLADRAVPELIKDCKPETPSSVEEGLSVNVSVSYTVTVDGDVADAKVTKSSGIREIDREAVRAVSRRKYKPAVQDGVARPYRTVQPFTFNT